MIIDFIDIIIILSLLVINYSLKFFFLYKLIISLKNKLLFKIIKK